MKEILKDLNRLAKARARELVREKEDGKPLIGYNSTFIPEELLRATGANTYLLCRGGEAESADAVLDYMLRFMNPLVRSMAGFLELGQDVITPCADLVVTAQTDCHIARISELLEYKKIPMFKVGIPADWQKDSALAYYTDALRRLLDRVQTITGQAVDEDAARENFRVSNAINACFRRIDALRRGPGSPISFEDYMRLQHLSFLAGDPEMVLEQLTCLCKTLETAPPLLPPDAPRLLLIGRVIAVGDYVLPHLLDACGASVPDTLLDECVRVTEKDVAADGDLVENFARNRYRDRLPIDIFQPSWRTRFACVREILERDRIDGVLWYQLAYDEIYDMEYICVSKWLGDLGIPLLKVETNYSYSREETGLLAARIEEFVRGMRGGIATGPDTRHK